MLAELPDLFYNPLGKCDASYAKQKFLYFPFLRFGDFAVCVGHAESHRDKRYQILLEQTVLPEFHCRLLKFIFRLLDFGRSFGGLPLVFFCFLTVIRGGRSGGYSSTYSDDCRCKQPNEHGHRHCSYS